MRDERPGELGLPGAADPGRRVRVAAAGHCLVLGGLAEQETLEVPLVGQRRADRPPGRPGQPGRGGHRDPVLAGQHAQERAVPQHSQHAVRQVGRPDPVQRGGRPGRPDHPAEHHARQHQVVQEAGAAGRLVRQVAPRRAAARHRPLAGRLGHGRLGGGPVQQARLVQRPVAQPSAGEFSAGAAGRADLAVPHGQLGRAGVQLGPGRGQERGPGLRAGLVQCATGILDRPAAGGNPLVRAGVRADRGHLDLVQRDVEFLRRDLGQRGPHALAVLDLAGVDDDPAGAAEVEPAAQLRVGHQAGGWRHSVAPAGAVRAAARSTARTIRWCVPHRHRLPSSAVRTSRSVGAGLRRSSATPVMIIPEVQ